MKKNCVLFTGLFLFLCLTASAQNSEQLTVFHVKGAISVKRTGKLLTPGDVLASDEQIQFGSANAAAIVYSSTQGRLTLKPASQNTPTQALQTLWLLVKENVLPYKSTGHFSTRGADTLTINDLGDHLGNKHFLIIGQEQALTLSPSQYPLSRNAFFYGTYVVGGKTIRKQIRSAGKTIFLNRHELFPNLPETDTLRLTLYYRTQTSPTDKNDDLVTTFTPVFAKEEALREECQLVADTYRKNKSDKKNLKNNLLDYLEETYDNAHLPTLEHWLAEKITF